MPTFCQLVQTLQIFWLKYNVTFGYKKKHAARKEGTGEKEKKKNEKNQLCTSLICGRNERAGACLETNYF